MKVINLFGGPSSGKSTISAGLFYLMKLQQLEVVLIQEIATKMIEQKRIHKLQDQLGILADQHEPYFELNDNVDFLITDSPLILSALYQPKNYIKHFKKMTVSTFNQYDNINFWINRPKEGFSEKRRAHSLEESIKKDKELKKMLKQYNIAIEKAFNAEANTHLEIFYYMKHVLQLF